MKCAGRKRGTVRVMYEVDFGAVVAQLNGDIVVCFRGEIDRATASAFAREMAKRVRSKIKLVFDFAAVTFMDLAGLSVLAQTLERLDRQGGSICIRNASRQVLHML